MIQAAWRNVECPTCWAYRGQRCVPIAKMGLNLLVMGVKKTAPHVARIAAGKAKRKGRHTGGRNKA